MKLQCSILAVGLLSSLVSAQGGFGGPPKQERVEVTKVEGFKWTDPFANRKYKRFTPKCSAKQTFQAFEYELRDMGAEPPQGLAAFGDGLKKVFRSREYPGGWGGWDKHRDDRSILMMEYFDVPVKVREWIEEQERDDGEGKGLFAVFNKPAQGNKVYNTVTPPAPEKAAGLRPLDKKKLVFFAPGAMYDILPLWVAAGSGCEAELSDLFNYDSKLVDGGVIAWPVSRTRPDRDEDKREIEFTIQAQVLGVAESGKEEL